MSSVKACSFKHRFNNQQVEKPMNNFYLLIELFIAFHMSHGKTKFRSVIYACLSK